VRFRRPVRQEALGASSASRYRAARNSVKPRYAIASLHVSAPMLCEGMTADICGATTPRQVAAAFGGESCASELHSETQQQHDHSASPPPQCIA